MNIKHFITIAASAAALSACVGNSEESVPTTAPANQTQTEQSAQSAQQVAPNAVFTCKNGMTVKTEYLSDANDSNYRIRLTVDTMELSTTLPLAQSGSGTRYAGKGFYGHNTEWHEKAGEANFQFHDAQKNKVETFCHTA